MAVKNDVGPWPGELVPVPLCCLSWLFCGPSFYDAQSANEQVECMSTAAVAILKHVQWPVSGVVSVDRKSIHVCLYYHACITAIE
jgi:hypothetical protein